MYVTTGRPLLRSCHADGYSRRKSVVLHGAVVEPEANECKEGIQMEAARLVVTTALFRQPVTATLTLPLVFYTGDI